MSETTGTKRLNAVVKELNVGMTTLIDFLAKKGHAIEAKPTTKLTEDQYGILLSEYSSEKKVKDEANKLGRDRIKPKDTVHELPKAKVTQVEEEDYEEGIFIKSGLVDTQNKKAPETTLIDKPTNETGNSKEVSQPEEIAKPVAEKIVPTPIKEQIVEAITEAKTTPVKTEEEHTTKPVVAAESNRLRWFCPIRPHPPA
jgi:translation initiation factor IF-2